MALERGSRSSPASWDLESFFGGGWDSVGRDGSGPDSWMDRCNSGREVCSLLVDAAWASSDFGFDRGCFAFSISGFFAEAAVAKSGAPLGAPAFGLGEVASIAPPAVCWVESVA